MSTPKVSICIPTYKKPEFFRRTLESVAKQDFTDYEVIVTDDTPDDSLVAIAAEFAKKLPLTYVKNTPSLGPAGNWNKAIDLGKGEYIKLLHHDDWFPEVDSLGKFVKLLDDAPEADFAFTGSLNFDTPTHVKFTHFAKNKQIARLKHNPNFLFQGNFIGAPSATIQRRRLKTRYDTQLKWLVDIDFYIKVLKTNPIFAYTTEPIIAITNDNPDQVTATSENNRSVELFEYVHVYETIVGEKAPPHDVFKKMWFVFEKYRVMSPLELTEVGITKLSKDLRSLINVLVVNYKFRSIWMSIKKLFSVQVWFGVISRSISYLYVCLTK